MSNLSNVQLFVNDPDAVFYVADQVYDTINGAHLEQWAQGKPELSTASWTLTAGADIVSIPASIMIPKYVEYNDKQYFISGQVDLEHYSSNWKEADQGQPKWFIRFSHDKIRVWPSPDVQYIVSLVGVSWPTEISGSNTNLNVDRTYDRAVEHQAAADLLRFVRPDLANIHEQESQQLGYDYRVDLRNQQSHNIRRIHPANRINRAQSGNISIGKTLK